MNTKFKRLGLALGGAAFLAIAGCGGSGGSAAADSGSGSGGSISGTAATGAPFAGATISIMDKSGNVVGTGASGVDGRYAVTLNAGAAGPFVLQAVRDDQTLVSVASDANGTINITPITNLIASRLAPSGDPAKLVGALQADPGLLSGSKIAAKTDEVVALLQPVLDAVSATANPLTGSFTADGSGMDRALDSLSIKITPESATTANIEVAVKQVMAEGDPPQTRQFSSASATLSPLPAVTAANLVKPGTAPLVAVLLAKMTSCYALPVADRVDTPDTNGQSATNIKASACKEMFYNNDPSLFKANGRVVGSNANINAFANIFRSSGNGLNFDRGTYEFTRSNGDIVIGYRSTDSAGNVNNDTFVVRPDNAAAPTKLQLIGNQYDYDGGITPYQQLRTFVNQPASDYYSTGYAVAVNNTLDGSNNPIFSKVIVTAPNGVDSWTLKPRAGYGTLQLVKAAGTAQETVTGTTFVRLRSEYVSAAKAGQDPAAADTPMFFASPPSTDAAITGLVQQGVWKLDYYLAAAPTIIAATQHYRTRARALSIGELKQRAFANLLSSDVADLVALSSATGYIAAPSTGPVLNWMADTGALPPTSLRVWGFISGNTANGFSDSLTVGSTLRTATVPCVKKTAADAHCTGTVVNAVSNYASGSQLNGLHLFARDPMGREFAHFYATYSIGVFSQ